MQYEHLDSAMPEATLSIRLDKRIKLLFCLKKILLAQLFFSLMPLA